MLAKQKELLMERLADFEATNRTLRKLLRDRHESEASGLRLAEQRDLLLKKLSETEDLQQRLRTDLLEKDRQLSDCRLQLDAQRVSAIFPQCTVFTRVMSHPSTRFAFYLTDPPLYLRNRIFQKC